MNSIDNNSRPSRTEIVCSRQMTIVCHQIYSHEMFSAEINTRHSGHSHSQYIYRGPIACNFHSNVTLERRTLSYLYPKPVAQRHRKNMSHSQICVIWRDSFVLFSS